jgi:hypothetical protein
MCVATVCALFASTQGRAQTQPAPNPNRTVNLNYVYAADLGFGGYSLAGLSADVYTLPLRYTLGGVPYDDWSLTILAPIQGGIYRFRATDTDGQNIAINQQSLALIPGAELHIPIGGRTVLKPFAQFGVVRAFGNDVGNPDAWVYIAGARAVTQWRSGGYTLSLGNAVLYAGDNTIGPGFGEHYVSLQIGGEIRHALGFKVGHWAPDLGLYAANYYYPAPLTFSRFLQNPLRVTDQGEIGFSVGSAEPLEMLWLSNLRLGVGFVFGGGLDVWHINFGFPF